MSLRDDLSALIKGEVADDPATLRTFSRDTSIFERTPAVVVSPKDADDISKIVRFVSDAKKTGADIALTPRSAGTDMTGGPLTDSVVLSFTPHMHRIRDIGPDYVVAEPGIYYRDLEKQTLGKSGALIPSYPASREICGLGGMIGNNSGGELTLRYGKTADYVQALNVVLSDGSATSFCPLSQSELAQKEAEQSLEGSIYRSVHDLIMNNREEIEVARPKVSKNSAGYALWDVWNEKKGTFDLTKLVVGSQGTLAIVTEARLRLVKLKPHRSMLIMFLSDIAHLPDVVHRVMAHRPESFESYDDHTFKLAVRFMPQIISHLGIVQMIRLGIAFLPELWMVLTGGVPKLVLMAEFAENTPEAAQDKAREARHALTDLPIQTKLAVGEMDAKKYWIIRRESFALLRKNLRGFYASPFIDDLVVPPESYPEFIPALNKLLAEYDLIYTIAGHIGNGNFHIIPLMNLSDEKARKTILELTPKVYALVAKFHGSTTGEHNDGIIRTPYVGTMFTPKMLELFAEIKKIFDPLNILNPGKKVGGTEADIEKYMIKSQ
jgi:FAD/FMN-containing dehydrogenase